MRIDFSKLTPAQVKLAREIEKLGLASYTKACKAILENNPIVHNWIVQMKKKEQA